MKTACILGVLVLSFSLCGIAVHAEDNREKGATAAAEIWLGRVDAGDYAGSWREASTYFQGVIRAQAWVASLQGVRTPLGQLLSRQLKQAQHTTSMPGAPDGDYVVMQFDTRFANKQAAVETVTCMQDAHGTWKSCRIRREVIRFSTPMSKARCHIHPSNTAEQYGSFSYKSLSILS